MLHQLGAGGVEDAPSGYLEDAAPDGVGTAAGDAEADANADANGLPAAAARERAADVLRHVGLAEERYLLMGT